MLIRNRYAKSIIISATTRLHHNKISSDARNFIHRTPSDWENGCWIFLNLRMGAEETVSGNAFIISSMRAETLPKLPAPSKDFPFGPDACQGRGREEGVGQ